MTPTHKTDRRGFLKAGLSLGALSLLTGCDLTDNEAAQRLLWNMSWWNDRVQGWLFNPHRLAPTYPESAVDRVFRFPAERVMPAGGIAVALAEIRQHRLQNARIDPRRRVVVHEYGQLDHRFILIIGLIEWDGW